MAKTKTTPQSELTTMEIIEQKVARGTEIEEKLADARYRRIEITQEEFDALQAEQAQLKQEIEDLANIVMGEKFIEMIQGKVALYRPFLPKIEKFIEGVQPEVARIIKFAFGIMVDGIIDLKPEFERISKMQAESIRRTYKNLVDEGFTPDQAMQIIIAQSSRPVSMPSFPNLKLSSTGR